MIVVGSIHNNKGMTTVTLNNLIFTFDNKGEVFFPIVRVPKNFKGSVLPLESELVTFTDLTIDEMGIVTDFTLMMTKVRMPLQ